MSRVSKLRGLASLVNDAVEHGSHALERVQLVMFERPVSLLTQLPRIGPIAEASLVVHRMVVRSSHLAIRTGNRATSLVLRGALHLLDAHDRSVAEAAVRDFNSTES